MEVKVIDATERARFYLATDRNDMLDIGRGEVGLQWYGGGIHCPVVVVLTVEQLRELHAVAGRYLEIMDMERG